MSITSLNQYVNVRYGSEVISSGIAKKIAEVFGEKSKISGMELSPGVGLSCLLSPGEISINGVTIEEPSSLTIPIPANSSGSNVTYYLYASYTHQEDASCIYDLLTSTTSSSNSLLIGSVLVPSGASSISSENISNEPISAKSMNAVSFSDRKNKVMEEVSKIIVDGVVIEGGTAIPSSTEPIVIHGCLTATRVYNPYLSDYAEYFERDSARESIDEGDIIGLHMPGDKESYVKASCDNPVVVGVYSSQFGHIIGGDPENLERYIPVALSGRVPVKVVGPSKKGDYIVLSKIIGIGVSKKTLLFVDKRRIVGIAMENKTSKGVGFVNCLVGKV